MVLSDFNAFLDEVLTGFATLKERANFTETEDVLLRYALEISAKFYEIKNADAVTQQQIEKLKAETEAVKTTTPVQIEKLRAEIALLGTQKEAAAAQIAQLEIEKIARKIEAASVALSVDDNLIINRLNIYSNVFASLANANTSNTAALQTHSNNIVGANGELQSLKAHKLYEEYKSAINKADV